MAMGFSQIWASAQGRSPDSGGETRAIDFGELRDALGRLAGLSTRDLAPKA